ncbi:MAG: ABC transporter permease [Chlorobi bacterium]|nr:ABC transporter permease [Chlorobiota bacterium]
MFRRSFSTFVAMRYLKPSRRTRFISFITAISAIGVMLGTCALLISLSILQGFDQTLRSTIIDFMGHIEVTGYYESDSLVGSDQIEKRITNRFFEVRAVSPFIRREAIIRSSNGLEGVLLKGVDPEKDVSTMQTKMISGSFIRDEHSEGQLPRVVLGKRLADKLLVEVGDTVVLFIATGRPDLNTPPLIEQFQVTGLYRSGMAQYDDIYVFSSIEAARSLLNYDRDIITGLDLLLHDPATIKEVAIRMQRQFREEFWAQPVFELFSSVFAWIDLQRMMIPFVMLVIAIVATFNVISTLLMTVLEKTESIATLSTIGASPRSIMGIFVSKGVLITGVGVVLGAILTLGFSVLQQQYGLISLEADIYVFESVPIAINFLHYVVVIFGTILLAMVATLVPAAIAGRLRPVATLRFQ